MLKTPLLTSRASFASWVISSCPETSRDEDQSIASFLGRRFGDQAVDRLAAPLLGGIYAGDVERAQHSIHVSPAASDGALAGSLIRGFVGMTRKRRGEAPSPFVSLRGGMRGSSTHSPRACRREPPNRTSRTTAGARREGYRVSPGRRRALDARAVILATPAHVAAKLVPDASAKRELSGIPYLSTATVFFALRKSDVEHSLDATGFVAPKGEAKIIAATWVSSKWDGRAPGGHVLIRAFLGGAHARVNVRDSSDDDLIATAREELEGVMGKLGPAEFTRVFRYIDANPQPLVGHGARLERIQARLRELPGLFVAGAAYDGVGIPDCIRQAKSATERILAERFGA